MALEDEFKETVKRWEAHCDSVSISSDPTDYADPVSIQAIVEMGREALPLIKAYLEEKPDSGILPSAWLRPVQAIAGSESEIPEEIKGNMKEIRAHLIATLS